MLATPRSHSPRSTPSAARGRLADDEPVRHVLDAAGGGRAERGAAGLRVRDPHRGGDRRRGVRDLARGSRSGAGRGRRASGTPARRRRTGTAPPAARGRWRRAPSRGRRAPASDGARLDGNAAASSVADPADLGLERVARSADAHAQRSAPSLTGATRPGGVARSIASQLMSRGAQLLVDLAAAAQPEQPLGVQQVDDDGEVDDEADDLQHRAGGG